MGCGSSKQSVVAKQITLPPCGTLIDDVPFSGNPGFQLTLRDLIETGQMNLPSVGTVLTSAVKRGMKAPVAINSDTNALHNLKVEPQTLESCKLYQKIYEAAEENLELVSFIELGMPSEFELGSCKTSRKFEMWFKPSIAIAAAEENCSTKLETAMLVAPAVVRYSQKFPTEFNDSLVTELIAEKASQGFSLCCSSFDQNASSTTYGDDGINATKLVARLGFQRKSEVPRCVDIFECSYDMEMDVVTNMNTYTMPNVVEMLNSKGAEGYSLSGFLGGRTHPFLPPEGLKKYTKKCGFKMVMEKEDGMQFQFCTYVHRSLLPVFLPGGQKAKPEPPTLKLLQSKFADGGWVLKGSVDAIIQCGTQIFVDKHIFFQSPVYDSETDTNTKLEDEGTNQT